MAVHTNERSGNAVGAGAHGFPNWSLKLFDALSTSKCRLPLRRVEGAHPVRAPVRVMMERFSSWTKMAIGVSIGLPLFRPRMVAAAIYSTCYSLGKVILLLSQQI